jgi:hypothetical protein
MNPTATRMPETKVQLPYEIPAQFLAELGMQTDKPYNLPVAVRPQPSDPEIAQYSTWAALNLLKGGAKSGALGAAAYALGNTAQAVLPNVLQTLSTTPFLEAIQRVEITNPLVLGAAAAGAVGMGAWALRSAYIGVKNAVSLSGPKAFHDEPYAPLAGLRNWAVLGAGLATQALATASTAVSLFSATSAATLAYYTGSLSSLFDRPWAISIALATGVGAVFAARVTAAAANEWGKALRNTEVNGEIRGALSQFYKEHSPAKPEGDVATS